MSDTTIDFGSVHAGIAYETSTESMRALSNRIEAYKAAFVRTYVGNYYTRGNDINRTSTIIKTVEVAGEQILPLRLDKSYIVQLGGEFEKIGESDEAVGGGSQKVGSVNK